MVKKYEISVDDRGIMSRCRMVDEEEYKTISKQSKEIIAKQDKENRELRDKVNALENEVKELIKEIKVLKGEE